MILENKVLQNIDLSKNSINQINQILLKENHFQTDTADLWR